MQECKHYNKHLDTIRAYISCLYGLDDCGAGGLLHIVVDDGNLRDRDIVFCLNECYKHPEREEAELGKLICMELLKLPMEQRKLVYMHDWRIAECCEEVRSCEECWIQRKED